MGYMKKGYQAILLSAVMMCAVFTFVTIAWATFNTTLKIGGQATVKAQTWNIYFSSAEVDSTNTTASNVAIDSIGSSTSTVTLSSLAAEYDTPGEKAVYNIQIKSSSTFDAKLTDFNLTVAKDGGAATQYSTLSYANENESLKYSVKWADGSEVTKDSIIAKETNKKLLVRVEYKDDNAAGFNSGTLTEAPDAVVAGQDATYVFTASLTYTQAN